MTTVAEALSRSENEARLRNNVSPGPHGPPEKAFVEIITKKLWEGRDLRVRGLIGGKEDDWIKTTGGGGVWETVKRPYLPPLTVWRGPSEPYTHQFTITFDGWHDNHSVEKACRELELMCGTFAYDKHGEIIEPPRLVLDGYGAIPHDVRSDPALEWIIPEPPEWGEPVRNEKTGERIRQSVTIKICVYHSDLTLRRQPFPTDGHRVYRIKRNETFEHVAKNVLHHGRWGTFLAKLNKKQNARENLYVGQEILLPNKEQERDWAKGKYEDK